jgi:transcriptional regulator with XRE-family HTH domain
MKESELELEKAFDRVVFGTNDPREIEKKLARMMEYLKLENSSLGHALAGIRHRHYWSLEQGAQRAGVSVKDLRDWESDMKNPTSDQLVAVLKKLGWSWDIDRFMRLRAQAGRVQLGRLAKLCPALLAASGKTGLSVTYEWRSLDDDLRERLTGWGQQKGVAFPEQLIEVLAGFHSDEEREAWMDEVLGDGEK